jgi:hypothetical protein
MATMNDPQRLEPHGNDVQAPRWWHWPQLARYAALVWSLLYGALGLYWTLGGAGFPFGKNDPEAHFFSILASVTQGTAAPVIAALGLLGALVAWTMARGRGRGALRRALLAFAWTLAIVLLVIVPDARVLVAAAYAPIVLIGAPFNWPPGDYLDALPWPVVNQFIAIAGGFAWGAAALLYQRRTRGACVYCGRTGEVNAWTAPAAAARWGKWATAVAALIPLVYAATRLAWALGIPLGLSQEFFERGQAEDTWLAGAALAAVAIAGSVLTLGLVQRWGERFPRWLPLVGGKRVPPALAIVPAAAVAAMVTAAGLMFGRRTALGMGTFSLTGGDWAALAPELLWPFWGAALGAATLAYYYRRRGRCPYCGRG